MTFQLPTIYVRYLSAPDATFLHLCLLNHRQYFTKLNLSIGHHDAFSQPWERGFIRYMSSPFYPACILFFQLNGGMVSLMQALATTSSMVHNTEYLDTYHESITGLAASS